MFEIAAAKIIASWEPEKRMFLLAKAAFVDVK
jgi:hypothetical protein